MWPGQPCYLNNEPCTIVYAHESPRGGVWTVILIDKNNHTFAFEVLT